MALVNVLVDVFDSFHSGTYFNIDMTVVPAKRKLN
jgi:hypothetical protein